MKVAVTGSSGFLGRALVLHLGSLGDEIVALDWRQSSLVSRGGSPSLDLARRDAPGSLLPLLTGCDEVYHMAGVLGTSELDERMQDAVRNNILATVHVLEAARAAKVKRFFLPAKPDCWRNTYTITKQAASQFALLYAERGWLDVAQLCYFNLFGPGQSLVPVRKVVPCFAAYAMSGLPLPVFGDGTQQMDLLHVDDAARFTAAYVRSERRDPLAVPDCGRGKGISVLDLAGRVNDELHNPAGVVHLPMRPGETPRTMLLAKKGALRNVVDDLSFGSFDDQLHDTLASYAALHPDVIATAVRHYEAQTCIL